ncbi:MAG: hypothetical protein ACXVQ0_13645, partial [Actinomycetota bacterium]
SAANDVVDTLSGRKGSPPIITDYRVGVVDYKDVDSDPSFGCPPDYDAVTDLSFSSKRTDITSALGSLAGKVGGGCDIPEDVLSGIDRALNFPWRSGVNKAVIVMGDAPGHDPEAHSGLTSASVIAHAAAVDPAHIYPILVGPFSTDAFMTNLAVGSGGQTFDSRTGEGVARALIAAITKIVTAPPEDSMPPDVTVSLPAPPDGQGGWFNASQTPVTGTVTATDPANVASIACTDSGGGLTVGPLLGGGTGTASLAFTVAGDGEHDITCTAVDGLGNAGAASGSANTGVVKIDATPPSTACVASPSTLWPPDNKLADVTVTVQVTDAGSGPGAFSLASATSNETGGADDIQSFTLGTPDVSGQLRAQRDGSGTGRVYTLHYTAADVAGNVSACDATVTVPHDQGKN